MNQLKTMWLTGQLTSETPYWFEGLTEWLPMGSLVEDEIAEEKRREDLRFIAAQKTAKGAEEKPIGGGEGALIALICLPFSLFTFLLGIIYCVAGKKQRGVRFMAWSLVWFFALFLFFSVVPL